MNKNKHICNFQNGICIDCRELAGITLTTLSRSTNKKEVYCPHARPQGQMCPHCMGVNNIEPAPQEEKCVCGEQICLGGAEVEIGGVWHRPNNPCYVISPQVSSEDELRKEFVIWFKGNKEKYPNYIPDIADWWIEKFSSRQISLIKMIVDMVESEKKENVNELYGNVNSEIDSFNQALDTISSKLKELIKE